MRLWPLSHNAHLAIIIEDVANNMKLSEPKGNEALELLGAMAQGHNPAKMKNNMGNINNMLDIRPC